MTCNEMLIAFLTGRQLMPEYMPEKHLGREMFSLWGEDAGIPAGDIHHHRAYRIYLDYDENRIITDADIVVEGELLSPCSGFSYEQLDEFDYPAIRDWCARHTAGAAMGSPDT